MTDETLAQAAVRRARYEVGLAHDERPEDWPEARVERMVHAVAENIINRGEDYRSWSEADVSAAALPTEEANDG